MQKKITTLLPQTVWRLSFGLSVLNRWHNTTTGQAATEAPWGDEIFYIFDAFILDTILSPLGASITASGLV
jgi:hypothetical protein